MKSLNGEATIIAREKWVQERRYKIEVLFDIESGEQRRMTKTTLNIISNEVDMEINVSYLVRLQIFFFF